MTAEEMLAMAREERTDGQVVTFDWDEVQKLHAAGLVDKDGIRPVNVVAPRTGIGPSWQRRWVLA